MHTWLCFLMSPIIRSQWNPSIGVLRAGVWPRISPACGTEGMATHAAICLACPNNPCAVLLLSWCPLAGSVGYCLFTSASVPLPVWAVSGWPKTSELFMDTVVSIYPGGELRLRSIHYFASLMRIFWGSLHVLLADFNFYIYMWSGS